MMTPASSRNRKTEIVNGLGVWLILIALFLVLTLAVGREGFLGRHL